MAPLCTCTHVRAVHKDGIGACSITRCECATYTAVSEDPLPPLVPYIPDAVKGIGLTMDQATDPTILAGLANLGNYLWYRLQQKNAKTIGEPVAEKKHEAECVRYKALLPKEWQW